MKPRKSDGQKFKSMPLKLSLKSKEKDKVLARWTDGLFYLVRVTKVSSSHKTCMVEFEDKSTATVHFKDLLEEKEEGSTQCHCCGKEEATSSNLLIKCSNCDRDYHQTCHVPPVDDVDEKFVCRICVFAACAQAGGAKSTGPLADKFSYMSQFFPYQIKYLTWNACHTSNVEQCFCYCGGPGIWYNKMLQCCRCRQWFHEACIPSIQEELLIGDRFFIFACAHCNHGQEFLQRMDLDWLSITHITMFHLIMTMGTRYVDLDSDILPFILGRSQSFGLKKLLNGHHGSKEAIRGHLINIFKRNNSIFCCGSEVKKRCTYFGIRERIPPGPSSIAIPTPDKIITAESLADAAFKKNIFSPSKYSLSVPYVLRGAKKVVPPTLSARLKESKLAKIARVKSEHNYCTPVKCPDDSPGRRTRKSPLPDDSPGRRTRKSPLPDDSPGRRTRKSPLPDDSPGRRTRKSPLPDDSPGRRTRKSPLPDDSPGRRTRKSPLPDDSPGRRTRKCLYSNFDLFDANNNSPAKHSPVEDEVHVEVDASCCSTPTFWSLDTAFPEPDSFSGLNHPFLTQIEQDSIRQQRKHFEQQLSRLAHVLFPDDEMKSCIPLAPIPSSTANTIKGFKGELAVLLDTNQSAATPKKPKGSCSHTVSQGIAPSQGISPRLRHGSARGSSLTSHCVNGSSAPKQPKNGIYSLKKPVQDIEAEKRLKALNRCLKNLTPTCGFRFPVLEEARAAVSPLPDRQLPAQPSPCSQTVKSKRKLKKGLKRKHDVVNECSEDSELTSQDLVRRSHRSRHSVKRFEASLDNKSYEYFEGVTGPSAVAVGADRQYEVISLRVRPDDKTVEYLVNWS